MLSSKNNSKVAWNIGFHNSALGVLSFGPEILQSTSTPLEVRRVLLYADDIPHTPVLVLMQAELFK